MQASPGQQPTTVEGVMKVCPILVGAMMMGQLTFGAMVGAGVLGAVATPGLKLDAVVITAFCVAGLVGAAGFFGLGAAWRGTAEKAWAKRADEQDGELHVARALFASTLVRAVMLEGPGLLGAVLALLTGERALLALTAASLVLMATLLRTRTVFEQTIATLNGRGMM